MKFILRFIKNAIILIIILIHVLKLGIVVSGSMLPTLQVGDTVCYTRLIPYSMLQLNDVAVYQAESGRLIIHRIYGAYYEYQNGKYVKYFIMKGDNNYKTDSEYMTPYNFRGKVIFKITDERINYLIRTWSILGTDTKLVLTVPILIVVLCLIFYTCKEDETK